jgi:hypothetical protein
MKINLTKIFNRDSWTCYLCAGEFRDGSLVPHHRANRGSGGYKAADVPQNVLSLCSQCNGVIESNAVWAEEARQRGVKISKFDTHRAAELPVFSPFSSWIYLDERYGFTIATKETR